MEETIEIGPVIRLSDADRVDSWVKEAVEAGRNWWRAVDVTGCCVGADDSDGDQTGDEGADEESFWAGVVIEPYDDFEDALAMVNHSRYGLQAGLYTRDGTDRDGFRGA